MFNIFSIMKRSIYLLYAFALILVSCSSEESESNFEEEILGKWQMEKIRVVGADCKLIYGMDVPDEYLADTLGCARPVEIYGNSQRCINVEFRPDGVGTFFWSEINGQEDWDITYSIENDGISFCLAGASSCSNYYKLVNGKLETTIDLTLDQDCSANWVLRRG